VSATTDTEALVSPLPPAIVTASAARNELAHEARLVGLREFHTPSLEAVERRRLQLWLLSIVMLLGASAIVTAGSLFPQLLKEWGLSRGEAWFSSAGFRGLMLCLTLGFTAYTIEKERHLRRLTRLLVDERVLSAALSNRLSEVTALLEAGKAINSVLEIDAVLHIILNSATSLLEATAGSIMLTANDNELHVVCSHGNDAACGAVSKVTDGIAGRVAQGWEPILVTGQHPHGNHNRELKTESAMCVPLLHRSQLLGVLNVNGGTARHFTEYDLRALSLFAEQAASAIANARLYETERQHVAELVENEMRKSEFLAAVSHDLRTPLTSVIGCAKMLQRTTLGEHHRVELAEMIDRQAGRLNRMIEDLLAAARLEAEQPPPGEPVDVAALARELADEYQISGRPFEVIAPTSAVIVARVDAVRRVLINLLDNAFKYGAPPVVVTITPAKGGYEVVVRDHGPGVPVDDRERIFERFTRLDSTRSTPGIGLGLSIVQGLVASCSGRVWVDRPDDGGAGSAFKLRFLEP
jgi:K+-sensing histidine kinase KdpD